MKKDYAGKPFRNMVAIGDSITMGASATKREYSWVCRLSALISQFQEEEMAFYNAGVSGNLLSERSCAYDDADSGKPSGLERIERDVISRKPDLVIISYGLNDVRAGTPIELFLDDLDLMVQKVRKETKALIVIVNTYFMTGYKDYSGVWGHADLKSTRRYNSRMKKYAKMNDLLYADAYGAQGNASWVVDRDGVHPNNLGHLLIANKVFEIIAANCSCLSVKANKEGDEYFRKGSSERWFNEYELPMRKE